MQEDGDKDDPPQPVETMKPDSDRDAVEEGMNQQPHQHRIAFVRVDELLGVRLFSEVKVRRNRVLKEMDEQVSEQNEETGARAAQRNALRHHLDQRRRPA